MAVFLKNLHQQHYDVYKILRPACYLKNICVSSQNILAYKHKVNGVVCLISFLNFLTENLLAFSWQNFMAFILLLKS